MGHIYNALWVSYTFLLPIAVIVSNAYFAYAVKNEVLPYFSGYRNHNDAYHARRAWYFLEATAIYACLVLYWQIMKLIFLRLFGPPPNPAKRSFGWSLFRKLILAVIIVGFSLVLGLACLIAKDAWIWSQIFATEGRDHLAVVCHGVAATLISSVAISVFIPAAYGIAVAKANFDQAQSQYQV